MSTHKLYGFTDVDRTADAGYFIRFLDTASADPSFQAYKQRSAALLEIQPGQRVLELGCGTGDDARALAALVGPQGVVVAVDGSQEMIAEAGRRAQGLDLPLQFLVADIHDLELPGNHFHAVRCDRTFMHLEDPARALAEMTRVARPGGRVLVFEVDFETLTVDVPDRSLARRVLNTWCDSFRNGWLGRHLPALFRQAGLKSVRVGAEVLHLPWTVALELVGPPTVQRALDQGRVTADEAAAWLQMLQAEQDAGRFFSTLTGFMVVGTKA